MAMIYIFSIVIWGALNAQVCSADCYASDECCKAGGTCGSPVYDPCDGGRWDYRTRCYPSYYECCLPLSPATTTTSTTTSGTTPSGGETPASTRTTTASTTENPSEIVCGVVPTSLIVGGQEAAIHSWPWIGSLQLDYFGWNGWEHHCTGTVIHPEWFLTAAHCIAKSGVSNKNNFKVILGMHYKTGQTTGQEKTMRVDKWFVHEDYSTSIAGSPHDLALIKFTEPLVYSRYIRPICLPSAFDETFLGENCKIGGFGDTKGQGVEGRLNEATVAVITNEKCNEKWETGSGRVNLIKSSHICAGNGIPGTCNGDSGGPLVCQKSGRWVQAGATSFGAAGCVADNAPDAYTRLSHYLDWIHDKIDNE